MIGLMISITIMNIITSNLLLTGQDMEPEVLEQFKQEAKERATLKDCVMLVSICRYTDLQSNTHQLLQTVEFRFGTKDCENPVEKVFFYSKIDTNLPFHIKRDQV